MRIAYLAPVALAALAVLGCRSGGAGNQELIERELRFQETELYHLQDQLDDACQRLDEAERENASLRKQLAGGSSENKPPSPNKELAVPTVELPPGLESVPPAPRHPAHKKAPLPLPVPTIEPGMEMAPPAEPAIPESSSGQELPPPSEPPRSFDAQGASHETPVPGGRPMAITVNPQQTVWRATSDRPEADKIAVVFEPRDAEGNIVTASGEVSIVLLDPAVNGPAARVARWDFRAADARKHFRSTSGQQGYHFDLHWPGRPPVHDSLELFVRLKTADGQRLVTNQQIQLQDDGGPSNGGDEPERMAAGNREPGADDQLLARRDDQRARLFARLRNRGNAAGSPAPPAQLDSAGSLNISVPDPAAASSAARSRSDVQTASKPGRLMDRTRLRGGPGVIDGSRIRSMTGTRETKPPQANDSRGEAPAYSGGNSGGEAPPFRNPGPSTGPAGQSLDPGAPVIELPEASNATPDQAPAAQSSSPPPATSARPTWRPYR